MKEWLANDKITPTRLSIFGLTSFPTPIMASASPGAVSLPRLRMRADLAAVRGGREGGLASVAGSDAFSGNTPVFTRSNTCHPPLYLHHSQAVPELAHLLGAAPPKPAPSSRNATTKTRRATADDGPSDAEALDAELARVKKEHAALLASLAAARAGAADTGAALQAADEARLRAEVAAKRAALDAAREQRDGFEAAAERARLATVDAEAGRGPPSAAAKRVAGLRAALAAGEAALDGDAVRQRLYTLLEERTRFDEVGVG